MAPQISIILPVRNAEGTLERALVSIANQSLTSFECLIINDGSTDQSARIMAAFAGSDTRFKVLDNAANGLISALNMGLNRADSHMIARMDADDHCHARRLEKQLQWLRSHPEYDLVSCRVETDRNDHNHGIQHYVDWSNTLCNHRAIQAHRFIESPIVHPTIVARKEALTEVGGYRDNGFPEDYQLWLTMLEHGSMMHKIPDVLYHWSDSDNRLTRTHARYEVRAFYQCKAGFLARWLARYNPHHPHIWVWGAGRQARKRVRDLIPHGIRIQGFIDIDPRKKGRMIDGAKVVDPAGVPQASSCFVVSYVASRGARASIKDALQQKGFAWGTSFVLAA